MILDVGGHALLELFVLFARNIRPPVLDPVLAVRVGLLDTAQQTAQRLGISQETTERGGRSIVAGLLRGNDLDFLKIAAGLLDMGVGPDTLNILISPC